MKKIVSTIISLALVLSLSACGQSAETKRTKDIAILYTGDVHTALEDNMGYEGIAALKNEMMADGMEVLLVDTGDAIQGSPIGTLSSGQVAIEIMNELGYSAMALGNHEFDYGMDTLNTLSKLASFPFLSLNFVDSAREEPVYTPYTIVERDGEKIAFLGVSTPKTITSSVPAYFQDDSGEFVYSFMQDESGEKLWTAVQKAVDAAKSEGADYVIALTHLGINAAAAPYLSTTLIEKTSGIDVVLDGHSHSTLACERVKNKDGNRVLLSATGSKLENIGYLLIEEDGNVSTGLVSGCEEKDAKTAAFVAEKKSVFDEVLKTPAANIPLALVVKDPATGVRIVRNAETNLGSLCADAMRKVSGADIGIKNGGGIRSELAAGEATYGDVLSVFPFGNEVCKIEVTGQQVLDALEYSVGAIPDEFGGFLQVSGLEFTYNANIPSPVVRDVSNQFVGIEGARRVQSVSIAGKPLEPSATYTLAGDEYTLISSGDGYTMFKYSKVIATKIAIDYDVLIDFLTTDYLENPSKYEDPYGLGRIVAITK